MTCIVGFIENGSVTIGGDSAGVSGLDMHIRKDPKVFIKDDMIFGFTSSFRMGQILEYCFNIPVHDQKKNDFSYLCSDFIDALLDCFKTKGYATINNNSVSAGSFLLGYKGNLYNIQDDFQVEQLTARYNAIGCGVNYALGAMKAMDDYDLKAMDRVRRALLIAESFSAGVSAPFTILKI